MQTAKKSTRRCPKCHHSKDIDEGFGFRLTKWTRKGKKGRKVVAKKRRVQSYCRSCRARAA